MKVMKIDNIEIIDHIWFRDLGIIKGRDICIQQTIL